MDAASWFAQIEFRRKTGKNPILHTKDYIDFLKQETNRDSMILQDYELIFASPAAVDSIVDERERQRLTNVMNYLKSHNDSTTISVFGYDASEVLNIGSRPRFEVKYVLAEED